ncbi:MULTISPECIES: FAD-dependent oxidoreductase [Pseudomonas]|uniref:FAD-dependent oxidoreductase n=1 Tax=Pseudomonas taiwanensis TaxID=470150 RepID=A0ABR6VA08_9PSED|nr:MULTISPECIES: FAD-dependent oxidoreductase [Pseudomonas]AGZ35243.1 FAD-dependent pyridine nucleotide-disulfide oxidoreductase [Pseudomonas sp. VLB120]AVD90482.1 pyridine nucleotide-disulfide oxidoreductase [Pseudomonas sp. SWI44]MBC3477306.1 FAD-dependent oxidoreductase [Pseudomonas taiwanensis]MBC3491647.1 FAD-dependent oxidoreductase [Pseudomonas taiwanensis]MDT8921533.1 FAD-dependent oxidoreductase [Pseudomonas taiwanensis]
MSQHNVARVEQLDPRRPLRVQAGSEELVLVLQGDQVHAYQANCPHAGAPLDEGMVCGGLLVCPWHKAAFAVDEGAVCEPPALTDLRRYRAWVKDGAVWVDDQPLAQVEPPRHSDARCFAVIGAGAAGSAAVATLLAHGFGGRLVWLDQEHQSAYDRTALSKFVIAGQMPADEVPALLEPEALRKGHLERLFGKVRVLDTQKRRITLADGRHIDYDAALLATGGKPHRPAIDGVELPGVFTLRSREDAARLLDAAEPGHPVVIVGDGFIGLEAASALRKYGAQVHVVTRHEVPLAKPLGERIGRSIRALHERKGVIFHGPTEVERLAGKGQVDTVVLANGETLAASVVLLGTGVSPATGCVQGLVMAQDKSLNVDAHMQAADGLWAAGDIATFPLSGRPVRIEHWRLAQQQGVIAAANMLGQQRRYDDVPFFWTYQHGRTYEVLGHARDFNRMEFVGEPEKGDFIALQCVDDQVEAVIAQGYSDAMAQLSQRMKRPLSLTQALELIG